MPASPSVRSKEARAGRGSSLERTRRSRRRRVAPIAARLGLQSARPSAAETRAACGGLHAARAEPKALRSRSGDMSRAWNGLRPQTSKAIPQWGGHSAPMWGARAKKGQERHANPLTPRPDTDRNTQRERVASRAPGGFAVLHAYRGASLVTAVGTARQTSPPRQDLHPTYDRPEIPADRRGPHAAAGTALGRCDGRSALDTEARSVRAMTTNLRRRAGPYLPVPSKRRWVSKPSRSSPPANASSSLAPTRSATSGNQPCRVSEFHLPSTAGPGAAWRPEMPMASLTADRTEKG